MADITLVPTLEIQRKLYDQPRGPQRFRDYLNAMVDGDGDLRLPLPLFNPMGQNHVRKLSTD